jgi:hypothetical protein
MSDYIDPDEGRDPVAPFFTEGEPCENCGAACESGTRTWILGFNYFACDNCAEEARIMLFAEENCPVLYDAVMRSRHVSEVQPAFREHQSGCPNCKPPVRREPAKVDAGRKAA